MTLRKLRLSEVGDDELLRIDVPLCLEIYAPTGGTEQRYEGNVEDILYQLLEDYELVPRQIWSVRCGYASEISKQAYDA